MEKRSDVHKDGVTEEMKEMIVQKQYMKQIRAKISPFPKTDEIYQRSATNSKVDKNKRSHNRLGLWL